MADSNDPRSKLMADAIGDDIQLLSEMLVKALDRRGIPGIIAMEVQGLGITIASAGARNILPALDMARIVMLSSAHDGAGVDGLIAACLAIFKDHPFVERSVFFKTLKEHLPPDLAEELNSKVLEDISESLLGVDSDGNIKSFSKDLVDNPFRRRQGADTSEMNPFSSLSSKTEADISLKRPSCQNYDGDFNSLSMDRKYDFVAKVKELLQADSGGMVSSGEEYFLKFPIKGSAPEHYWEDFQIEQQDGENIINLTSLYERAGSLPYLREAL